jgi:hypothetical protein
MRRASLKRSHMMFVPTQVSELKVQSVSTSSAGAASSFSVRGTSSSPGRRPMPFVHRLGKRLGDPGTDADQLSFSDAVQLISENRYRLARDIRSIGFRTADQVAARLGIGAVSFVDAHRARGADAVAVPRAGDAAPAGCPRTRFRRRLGQASSHRPA